MKKYENIYYFQAMQMLEEGKSVRMLDKKHGQCYVLADLTVGNFIEILAACKDENNENRFVFWVEGETEEVEA